MPEPYVGEIRMFAGNFAPVGWMLCNGQILSISENDVLFTLIGTTYGGDGESTFALPNLQSRIPIHMGTGPEGQTYTIGQMGGTEEETLTLQQIPTHTHAFLANTSPGSSDTPGGQVPAQTTNGVMLYREVAPGATLSASAVAPSGGSQPHTNVQPFLCINYIISLFGIFPSQT